MSLRRQQAAALQRRRLHRIARNNLWLSVKGALVKGAVIFLRKNDSPLKDGAEARIEFYILPIPLNLPTQKINYTKPQNNVKIYNNA